MEVSTHAERALIARVDSIVNEAAELRGIYDDHAGVRDRFTGTGILTPALAVRLGVLGLAGRASGQSLDGRVDRPWPPYGELAPSKIVRGEGDVAARVAVRFDELRSPAGWCGGFSQRFPRAPCDGGEDSRGRRLRRRTDRGVARAGLHRAGSWPGRRHPSLPSARFVRAGVAGDRACDPRQSRAGFPAHQQIFQPGLQRGRPVRGTPSDAQDASQDRLGRTRLRAGAAAG